MITSLLLLFALSPQVEQPTPPERLFEIRLPAGDVPGWSIDVKASNLGYQVRYFSSRAGLTPQEVAAAAPGSFWLDDGDGDGRPDYDGVRFVGEGWRHTNIRPPANADTTILVTQANSVMRIEGATIHCGSRRGILFGFEHAQPRLWPGFRYELERVHVRSRVAPDGRTTKWGIQSYGADEWLQDVFIDVKHAAEHGTYVHGYAGRGSYRRRVVTIAGAECDKVTWRPWEAAWAEGAQIIREDCHYIGWYFPWTDRGGGGFVGQGPSVARISFERCTFWNPGGVGTVPASSRTRAFMLDDGSDNDQDGKLDFYNAVGTETTPAGVIGRGHSAGVVSIRQCLFYAGPGTENLSLLLRVGNLNPGGHYCASRFVLSDSALYGERLQVSVRNVAPGQARIVRCNTAQIETLAAGRGADVTHEAKIPLPDRVADVSEGRVW